MLYKNETRNISLNRSILLTLLFGSFAVGIFVGAGMGLFTSPSVVKSASAPETPEGMFKFIRAFAEPNSTGRNQSTRELKPFRYKVDEKIEMILNSGDASAVSIYFRDLNNGNWFGIGEHDKFLSKKLLKVPLMIAYFKWAEANPLILRKTLIYTGGEQREEGKGTEKAKQLEPGKGYSINDLIFRMIAYDNDAAYTLLYTYLPPVRLERIYSDLTVEYDPRKQGDPLSLNAFAAFYRVLYNSSYLSEDMSEKALRYLSKAAFLDGMSAGVPSNVDIAAKQGAQAVSHETGGEGQELWQLHEFGIIYHPNRPFLLGIMTQGTDRGRMTKVIRDITRLVYEEVDKQS